RSSYLDELSGFSDSQGGVGRGQLINSVTDTSLSSLTTSISDAFVRKMLLGKLNASPGLDSTPDLVFAVFTGPGVQLTDAAGNAAPLGYHSSFRDANGKNIAYEVIPDLPQPGLVRFDQITIDASRELTGAVLDPYFSATGQHGWYKPDAPAPGQLPPGAFEGYQVAMELNS